MQTGMPHARQASTKLGLRLTDELNTQDTEEHRQSGCPCPLWESVVEGFLRPVIER